MIIIGGGGHARVIAEILDSMGVAVEAFATPTGEEGPVNGIAVIAQEAFTPRDNDVIVGIGDNDIRKSTATKFPVQFGVAIHRSAIISPTVTPGQGTVVMHGAIVQTGVTIGSHVIINTGASIDHDCVVADFAHIAPRVVLTGNVKVGEGTLIGAGASIAPGIRVGNWAIVGTGSVVVHDVPDFAVAVGNPAKVVKYVRK